MSESIDLLNLHASIENQATIKDFIRISIESCILSPKNKSNYINVKKLFHKLRWQSIYQSICLECIGNIILQHLIALTQDATFEERLLDKLKKWLATVITPFLEDFLQYSKVIHAKLYRASLELFVNLQFRKLFEMITEFPDSLVALKELHHCINVELESYDTLGIAGPMLRNILSRRLLHLGATTSQILDFYISMIKSLRVIDPTDALLNFVAIPVRTYLQNRNDTIRCIISSLTETKDSDLHGELRHGGSLAYGIDEDDEDIGHGEHWVPTKRNQQIMELSDKSLTTPSRGLDILATLVSIYGSTELFINEYTQLLAEKMLHHATLVGQKYSTEQEVGNIELLKIRFGEESLHNCEVMLKDIEDSKRANVAVHSALKTQAKKATGNSDLSPIGNIVDELIISDNYWPNSASNNGTTSIGPGISNNTPVSTTAAHIDTSTGNTMQYHPLAQLHLDAYCESYSILKKPRKLRQLANLGTVEIDIEFDNGVIRNFVISPIQANIIMFLSNDAVDATSSSAKQQNHKKKVMSLQELVVATELEEADILAAIQFWIRQQVIRECDAPSSDKQSDASMAYGGYGEEDEHYYEIIEEQSTSLSTSVRV